MRRFVRFAIALGAAAGASVATGAGGAQGNAQIPARAAIGPSAYVPGEKDWQGVEDALATYRWGLEHGDRRVKAMAFAEGGYDVIIVGGNEVSREVKRGADMVMEGPRAVPPQSGGANASAAASPPPQETAPGPAVTESAIWHVTMNDSWRWESRNRVVHYAYWLSIYPGSERLSTVGAPGHYEDVLERIDGKWLIRERKIFVGTK